MYVAKNRGYISDVPLETYKQTQRVGFFSKISHPIRGERGLLKEISLY